MKTKQFVILSVHRRAPRGYFVAIHGFTPYFGEIEKARRFDSEAEAKQYANDELFTSPDASVIQEVA